MISYVIPTYNRSAVIRDVVKRIVQYAEKQSKMFEIILVDDGSNDHTESILKEIVEEEVRIHGVSRIKGIVLDNNYGQQNATLAGIRTTQYPTIITLDDDLEYDLNAISLIVKGLQSGYDVMYVVNQNNTAKAHRKYGTVLKESIFSIFCGKPLSVQLTSYRGMNRSVAEYVAQDMVHHVYISARILQKTKCIGMVETNYHLDQPIQTNYNSKRLVLLLWRIIWNYALFSKRNKRRMEPEHSRISEQLNSNGQFYKRKHQVKVANNQDPFIDELACRQPCFEDELTNKIERQYRIKWQSESYNSHDK